MTQRQNDLIRRCFGKRCCLPDLPVLLQTGPDGFRLRALSDQSALEFHSPEAMDAEQIIVPLEALKECAGSRSEPVTVERSDTNQCTFRWNDRGIPQVASFGAPELKGELPPTPDRMQKPGAGLLAALRAAVDTVEADALRYATDCMQTFGFRPGRTTEHPSVSPSMRDGIPVDEASATPVVSARIKRHAFKRRTWRQRLTDGQPVLGDPLEVHANLVEDVRQHLDLVFEFRHLVAELSDLIGRGRWQGIAWGHWKHRVPHECQTVNGLSPVFDHQTRNPDEVSRVTGDEDAAGFDRGCSNDEIGIATRLAALVGERPKISGTIKDGVGDRQHR
jgi:hypothetical protein